MQNQFFFIINKVLKYIIFEKMPGFIKVVNKI